MPCHTTLMALRSYENAARWGGGDDPTLQRVAHRRVEEVATVVFVARPYHAPLVEDRISEHEVLHPYEGAQHPEQRRPLDLDGGRQQTGRGAAHARERRRRLGASDDEAVDRDVHAPDRTMHLRRASHEQVTRRGFIRESAAGREVTPLQIDVSLASRGDIVKQREIAADIPTNTT